jgi:hypothetical protein
MPQQLKYLGNCYAFRHCKLLHSRALFRYYEVRKFLGDDGRGAARVNMEGLTHVSVMFLSSI